MSRPNVPAHGDRRGALPSAAAVDQELDSLADSFSVLQEGGADFCTARGEQPGKRNCPECAEYFGDMESHAQRRLTPELTRAAQVSFKMDPARHRGAE